MPRSMMNRFSIWTLVPTVHVTRSVTLYFGGGTSACTTAFMLMMGRFAAPSFLPTERPSRECSRLCHDRLSLWLVFRRWEGTARSVCALIVSGFGYRLAM